MRRTVEMMSAYGITHDEIAGVIGCSDVTLRKCFGTELQQAQPKANSKVAHTLFQKAMGGDTTAMIFWLKCRAGWRERTQVEYSGQIGIATVDTGLARFESELARIVARARESVSPGEVEQA